MARGERAERLANAAHDACYMGRRPTNKGYAASLSRDTHISRGMSHKTYTHRVERRQGEREVRRETMSALTDPPFVGCELDLWPALRFDVLEEDRDPQHETWVDYEERQHPLYDIEYEPWE